MRNVVPCLILGALFLGGCADAPVVLRHEETKQIVRCVDTSAPLPTLWSTNTESVRDCVKAYEKLGFKRLPKP
jgi:hypothetical protein